MNNDPMEMERIWVMRGMPMISDVVINLELALGVGFVVDFVS